MAKCRIFAIDEGLKTVVENGLYSKHLFGTAISISVVKFVAPRGPDIPAKAHHHGEEASLQIIGGCNVIEGTGNGDPADPVTYMGPRTALIIPGGISHYGTNYMGREGASMRLNVVTPPRPEFGPEDGAPYYPLRNRGNVA
ncbi:hypothetical protein SAMN05518849_1265 [Sphingobium sp. AP50]|uniref:cupin n=1 Tax=Sphingobium sp. AP50 TaxID=1884369 RepID=UPI0008B78C1A|nr:cupin [Sphingobium sp. AP50]SEK00718.1 hypothetical protein SAMN05518849_1265 [Sphingobium sp. AP50]